MFKNFKDVPKIEVIPGFTGQFIHGKTHTLALWDIKKGSAIPEHSHVHEQIMQVLEGQFELMVNGQAKVCGPGDFVVIPSQVVHSGVSITDCKVLDTFCPVREDYKTLSDSN